MTVRKILRSFSTFYKQKDKGHTLSKLKNRLPRTKLRHSNTKSNRSTCRNFPPITLISPHRHHHLDPYAFRSQYHCSLFIISNYKPFHLWTTMDTVTHRVRFLWQPITKWEIDWVLRVEIAKVVLKQISARDFRYFGLQIYTIHIMLILCKMISNVF